MIPDRMRSLISVLLIKVCLGDYYEIPPREIKIVRVTGKKPYFHFENNSKYKHIINFNVSHDNEVVVIAISKFIVGIDTMKLEFPRKNESNDIKEHTASKFFLNMKNVFSNCEWSYIGNDIGRFMEYWTIKESFVKCIGVGLYIEPSRLLVEKDYFLNDTYINKIFLDNVSQVRK